MVGSTADAGATAEGPGPAPVTILTGLPDGLVVLGPDGRVAWANPAAAAITRRPAGSLVGLDALALVHPDELERAVAGIEYSLTFPDRTAVVPYRVAAGDGGWVDVELKAGVVPGPDGDVLVLVLRDASTRAHIAATLAAVAGGAPIATSAHGVAEAIVSRWPGCGAAVVYDDDAGTTREVVAVGLPAALVDALHHPRPDAPWARAARDGRAVIAADEELGDLRAPAAAAGLRACAVAPVLDPVGEPALIVVWYDEPAIPRLEFVTEAVELVELLVLALERRAHLRRLWEAARTDPLTGLVNRTGFFERLAAIGTGDSGDGATGTTPPALALLYLDLDGFKPVNDRFGHLVGDGVLATVADRLRLAAGERAVVARLGGDEFAVLARVSTSSPDEEATALADRLLDALRLPMAVEVNGAEVGPLGVGASIGIALRAGSTAWSDAATRADDLLERADAAMYRAKATGRGRWCLADGDAGPD